VGNCGASHEASLIVHGLGGEVSANYRVPDGSAVGPEVAWRRPHRAMKAGDYGTVYDCLSAQAKRDADAMFLDELANAADRTTDSANAAWLRYLRGREAYIEAANRIDQSIP
jgi:hypothetical protein